MGVFFCLRYSQLPQSELGNIFSEHVVQAVRREVLEELGLEVQIEFVLGTAHFYRGDAVPENEMVGVHYGCSIQDSTSIQLSDEHSAHQWVTAEQAQTLIASGYWLRELIARAEVVRRLMPKELVQLYSNGFDL